MPNTTNSNDATLQCRLRSANFPTKQEKEHHLRLHCAMCNVLTGSRQGPYPEQIALFTKSTAEDRAALTWLAAIKHIPFVFEFAADAMRDKLAMHDTVLRPSDYEDYVEANAVTHPEISELSGTSSIFRVP